MRKYYVIILLNMKNLKKKNSFGGSKPNEVMDNKKEFQLVEKNQIKVHLVDKNQIKKTTK